MGIDIGFVARHKNGKMQDSAYFLFRRAAGTALGQCLLSYFGDHLPAQYSEYDSDHNFPTYYITLKAWNESIAMLRSKEEDILYLSDYVLSAFDFDEDVPEEYRELKGIDLKTVTGFDRWFSKTFHFPSDFELEDGVISVNQETCQRVIRDAYTLMRWLEMDELVRKYLLDENYQVELYIG